LLKAKSAIGAEHCKEIIVRQKRERIELIAFKGVKEG
jgi:hypothetical protein